MTDTAGEQGTTVDRLTPARLLALTGIPGSADDERIRAAVEAANAYVRRYRGDVPWTADMELGAAKLAAGLVRDGYKPTIGEGWEQNGNVFARVTDVEIEQLLRIGRFAPPVVG